VRDPVSEDGGAHLYGFVVMSPVNSVDYLGMWTWPWSGCCGGRSFNRLTQCCLDGAVHGRWETRTSDIRSCRGSIDGSSVHHFWIELGPSYGLGFATEGSIFGSWGKVRDDVRTGYVRRAESTDWLGDFTDITKKFCRVVSYRPCATDIERMKGCIRREMGRSYWYVVGARDCRWWVVYALNICRMDARR
jgi:hypothetical protein